MPVSAIIPIVEDYREVILPAGYADQIRHSLIVGDYLYYFCGFPLGQMLKINKNDFTDRTVLTFPNDGKHRVPLEMCHVGGILYCLFRNVDTNDVPSFRFTIGRVQTDPFAILSDFVDVSATYIVQNGSITTDGTSLYVIVGTATLYATRKILKYAISGGAPTVADVTGFGSCHCVRYSGGKLYLTGWDFPANAHVARMTTALVIEQSVDFEAADGEFYENEFGISTDHIWVSDRSLRGIVKKFQKSNLTIVTDLPTGQLARSTQMTNDGRDLWVLFENGRSVRFNPSSNAQAIYALNDGQGFQSELLGDGTYIWAGWNQDATKIARYHIPSDVVPSLNLVGFLPGLQTARDVKVVADVAYVACDKFGLSTVDVSNLESPAILGSSDVPFDGRHVVVSGSHAYVTGPRTVHAVVAGSGQVTTVNGFWVIDISIPSTPIVVGRIESSTISFEGFAISGSHAFVASQSGGIRVIDISQPASPSIAATFPISGFAGSVEISGTHAYVTMGTSGLRILNISNPTSPSLAGTIDTPGTAVAVAISGNFAYVADTARLQVIDVSVPGSPLLKGSISRTVTDVIVSGNFAYVSCGASGLMIASIIDPNNPTEVSIENPPSLNGAAGGAFLVGANVYLANQGGGLAILDVSNTSNPSVTSVFSDIFQATGIALKSSYAILTGLHNTGAGLVQTSEILVVDISNKARPTVAARLTSAQASTIAISGNYAYVPSGSLGLRVINLTNPLSPSIEATFALGGFAQGVGISGIHAYVGLGTFGVKIVNISNPSSPSLTGSVDTPGTAGAVDVASGFAYISDSSSLRVANVSNPSDPSLVGSLTRTNNNVKVQEPTLYLSGNASGMFIIDVTTPSNPTQLSVLPPTGLSGATAAIALSGTLAYLANQATGVAIADVSNRNTPTLVASMQTVGVSKAIALEGLFAYVADTLAGIDIIAI